VKLRQALGLVWKYLCLLEIVGRRRVVVVVVVMGEGEIKFMGMIDNGMMDRGLVYNISRLEMGCSEWDYGGSTKTIEHRGGGE